MKTNFSEEQLQDPQTANSNKILRTCVHCGFCIATCPTYQVLGDELDSPRGRIYLIKEMLENGRPADRATVKHIDRCLTCLSCMTTCPSGVDYMHLIDHAREHIARTYRRSWDDRVLRWLLRRILPHPTRFRLAMLGARIGRPIGRLIPDRRIRAMLDLAPSRLPQASQNDKPQLFAAEGERKWRVALMTGCVQRAVNTEINDATIRLLRRLGCDVVVARGTGCCGALSHHMGEVDESRSFAERNVAAWGKEIEGEGLDSIIINTSGCGTTIKDYGTILRDRPNAEMSNRIAKLAEDVTEFVSRAGFGEYERKGLRIAYHAACSLQHGQRIGNIPKTLLGRAGFDVVEPIDSHLCCGSAGTYNLLQPEISEQLRDRKVTAIEELKPDAIAAGNLGCMVQIASKTDKPVVHTVQLLDWASGGPKPPSHASWYKKD